MPEYLSPGVYVKEIPASPKPIEGVGTSTAGFVGETARGPVRLTVVNSWKEFVRRYGEKIEADSGTSPYLPHAVRGFFENGGRRVVVARVAGDRSEPARLTLSTPSGAFALRATGPGAWGNTVAVTIEPSSADPPLHSITIDYADVSERFDDLSTDPKQPRFAPAVVNPASELVEITSWPQDSLEPVSRAFLSGGTDARAHLADYLGDASETRATGLATLASITGISILAAPGDVSIDGLAGAVLDVCEKRKDRFAVTAERDPARAVERIHPIRSSSWGATYFPWLRVGDDAFPPHGHVCGILARVATARGIHHPPANEEVRGITGLSRKVTQAEQEILNPRGVNVIRDFGPARGIVLWGGRTMASDSEWKYVNVRRLFIFIERSIEEGLQWVVFEPNTEPTWREVRRSVEEFLMRLWRDGALMGDRPESAFFVRCDRTTMTQADIDQGRLICEIGVAPVRPAEFVIFRIAVRTSGDDDA